MTSCVLFVLRTTSDSGDQLDNSPNGNVQGQLTVAAVQAQRAMGRRPRPDLIETAEQRGPRSEPKSTFFRDSRKKDSISIWKSATVFVELFPPAIDAIFWCSEFRWLHVNIGSESLRKDDKFKCHIGWSRPWKADMSAKISVTKAFRSDHHVLDAHTYKKMINLAFKSDDGVLL